MSLSGIIKLDQKDCKILQELDFNARIPYSELGKKVGLSKQGAEYRVETLIKKGVIKGFYPVINVPKLGYLYCRLLLTFENTSKEEYQSILDFISRHKKVFWLFKMQGVFDVILVAWCKSLLEFQAFIEEIEIKFSGFIKHRVENIMTDVIHYRQRYLLESKDTKEIHLKETQERIQLDDLDLEITRQLCSDGRISLVKIASLAGVSAKLISLRLKKLEQRGIIEAYRPIIDHNTLGFTYYKIFISLKRTSREQIQQIKEMIRNNPQVIYQIEGIALPLDLDIEVMVSSNKQLFDLMEKLKFAFPKSVGEYQTVIFMDTLKVKYLPF